MKRFKLFSENVKSNAFKNWFGNSRVIDARGKPLPLYHGTRNYTDKSYNFNSFENNNNLSGFYFTNSILVAKTFGLVDSFYLKIERPIIIDCKKQYWNKIPVESLREYSEIYNYFNYKQYAMTDEITNYVGSNLKNYDGIIYKNMKEVSGVLNMNVSDVYVVFKANQIKSTSNTGVYNPNDDRFDYGV